MIQLLSFLLLSDLSDEALSRDYELILHEDLASHPTQPQFIHYMSLGVLICGALLSCFAAVFVLCLCRMLKMRRVSD